MAEQSKGKFNILLGLMNSDENYANQVKAALKEYGVYVDSIACKYKKLGIDQYINENSEINVVIVSEYLESISPYTVKDFSKILDKNSDVILIPVIMQKHKGGVFAKELYQVGVFNAVFEEDASMDAIAKLILRKRSRKEARVYYGIQDEDAGNSGANIIKCREYISLADDYDTVVGNARYIKDSVTDKEFYIILSGLSDNIKEKLIKSEEFSSYFAQEKEKLPVKTKVKESVIDSALKKFNRMSSSIPILHNEGREVKVKVIKEKTDLTGVIKNVLIGFAGTQRRVGTTHQAIMAAHMLKKNGYKVAIVELKESRNKSFESLATCFNIFHTGTSFTHEGVDYYKEFEMNQVGFIYSKKYNFIIIDFGIYRNIIKNDLAKCAHQIIVSAFGPWEKDVFNRFLEDVEKEGSGENFNYLLQSPGNGYGQRADNPDIPEERFVFSEYSGDLFSGKGYPGLRRLFIGFLDNKFLEKSKKSLFSIPITQKQSTALKPVSKAKVELRGRGVAFLTSLKNGAGCTHFGVAVSNYLSHSKSSNICFINRNSATVSGSLDPSVITADVGQDYNDLYVGYDYLVFDCGVIGSLKQPELIELKRADYKVLMCLTDDDYMNRLATFIREYGDEIKEWLFVFNILPHGKESEIRNLMRGYKIYFLPLFDAAKSPGRTVHNVLSDIF